MNRQNLKKQRKRLWENDPNCYYCGCLTILPENVPTHSDRKGSFKKGEIPDNMATIEHLTSRLNTDRGRIKNSHVLSCAKCNHSKSKEEQESLKEIWTQLSNEPSLRKRKKIILRYKNGIASNI